MLRLREAAEKAKNELSSQSTTTINLLYITVDAVFRSGMWKHLSCIRLIRWRWIGTGLGTAVRRRSLIPPMRWCWRICCAPIWTGTARCRRIPIRSPR
jgi:hypothetical protein